MVAMSRTRLTITLSEARMAALTAEAKRLGLTVSELVARWIDQRTAGGT
jgi:hypothetical protein